jgi:hypothetical protein
MAEFKLGRIRFIWKGNWASSTVYYKDDIVRNGANTYVCIAGHTAPALFTDLQDTYWNKISDGTEWKSNWTTSTYYKVNDVVKYGGYLYLANTAHTSAATDTLGLEADLSKWDLYAEGFDYKTNWAVSTRYKINDIVKYNATVYICTEGHTSAATEADGLEPDQNKWDIFSEGFNWTDTWTINVRYRVNDIVRYGGTLYICNEGHTSAATEADGLELDQAKWDYLHKGIEYLNNWAPSTRYKINDVVKYGGGLWICTTYHTSSATNLAADEVNWAQFVEGLEFEDSWDSGRAYQPGDFVTYGGYSYIARTNNVASKPSDNLQDWELFTAGFRFVGDYDDDSTQREYIEGDVIRLGGSTYLCIKKHEGFRPPNPLYWELLNEGIEWQGNWTDATYYDMGDTVQYGVNSYICITPHTSDETVLQNRPDQDVDGSEWNLLVAGAESGNLTTEGDLVYYGGAGPTRLPIGQVGQTLKVSDNGLAPEWAFTGAINNVFYIETNNGVDEPAPSYGVTIDRPFKTVRYAAEQILAGALRYNAKNLLERNRSFIQDEVIEYINATYPVLVYDEVKCRRDAGQVLDAVIWDLSHGGNERSRKAARSYFDVDGVTYLADNATETADGLNYIKTVADAVLSNVAPATIRGSLNQYVNANFIEEADALSTVETLVNIVTNAITAGSVAGIPAERKPQNTMFVKTGEFEEVLPIIVPENTAVVGDELRSTRIKPAGVLVDSGDSPYTLDAINRLSAIMSNIVTHTAVIKTPSNGLDPVTTSPAGSAQAGADAANLWTQIYDYIDYGLNGATSDSTIPLTTGSNIPNTTTDYTYAVETIEANREFLVAEVLAYIATTYPSYVYNVASCQRDVNRYIDAIKYDLIYTGNYKSLLAARYYLNAVSGSLEEDMFYMRNGTGLRNCTTIGLTGFLGAPNAYGTRRPSAGAFVSLDPGWGPDHEDAWIINKSPYVQNVTTFGTGCVGCKIDGDLHNGGNDSIVSNDFTQIISDGIGVWCTNLGRTELVSVFSYYGHIGYLAENGGKIRATNGNSSYGTFGTVAEGIDITEIPVIGTVDNYALQAFATNVLTDGNNLLTIEYLNAGVNYTPGGTTITAFGDGFGLAIDQVQTVDGGVFEVRMLDPNNDFGGEGYIAASNVAQGGNATSISISNTDTRLSTAYIGMAIYLTAGRGAGQYAYIDTYNSGTKLATVRKMSDGTPGWDHVIGRTIETTLNETSTYIIEPRITFSAPPSGLYADTAKGRAEVEDGKLIRMRIWDPGQGYESAPTIIITDPNNTVEAPYLVRIGDGVLTQPTWTNRGTGVTTASVTVEGDGYADMYQPGTLINVKGLTALPQVGSNFTIANNSEFYKLVTVRNVQGASAPFSAQFQISPNITVSDAPEHDEPIELRIRYSQVRLTGHDFLDIGTGNFADTNYPGQPINPPDPNNETVVGGGGRVFYTSTDQDGNFRVGRLFNVEQSTGVATLNADAFNITGLNELQLGAVELGGTGATITEFSVDGTFTANSDSIVPTQRAIRTYIASQIGGGAGELNVNSMTAGVVKISGQQITTTTGAQINILQKVNFTGGIKGSPVALNYFLSS